MIFDSIGASVTYQSLALSFSAFTQVPMMMLARPLSRFSPYVLLLGACGLYLVSNAIIGFSASALVVLGGYLIAGLAYGLLLPTLRQAILVSSTPRAYRYLLYRQRFLSVLRYAGGQNRPSAGPNEGCQAV